MTTKSLVQAGVAEIDITPPMGIEMWGYGPYERRICTEVLDPLFARALWMESENVNLVIITVDLGSIDISTHNEVVKELYRSCRINESNILIAASHTHSGPASQKVTGWGECDPAYMENLPKMLVKAALDARKLCEPVRNRIWSAEN